MKAFHNSQQIKDDAIKLAQWHVDQDMLLAGTYGEGDHMQPDFRGCDVGCLYGGDHKLSEELHGIPVELTYLADYLFEELPEQKRSWWHVERLKAIPVGADLSLVWPQYEYWLIYDKQYGLINIVKPGEKVILLKYEYLLRGEAAGKPHVREEYDKALDELCKLNSYASRISWASWASFWASRASRASRESRISRISWASREGGRSRVSWVQIQADKMIELLKCV